LIDKREDAEYSHEGFLSSWLSFEKRMREKLAAASLLGACFVFLSYTPIIAY
jgi:diacylglycerol kinase